MKWASRMRFAAYFTCAMRLPNRQETRILAV
jgi:hypothetical protein